MRRAGPDRATHAIAGPRNIPSGTGRPVARSRQLRQCGRSDCRSGTGRLQLTTGDPGRRQPADLRQEPRSEYLRPARRWLEETINLGARIGLPWPTLLAFLRITTNPRIFEPPLRPADAWTRVDEWLAQDNTWVPAPTEQHAALLVTLFRSTSIGGNLVPDVHLAALAMEHGLELLLTNTDYARFPDLRWRNPLVSQ